jgi:hypothetical protein
MGDPPGDSAAATFRLRYRREALQCDSKGIAPAKPGRLQTTRSQEAPENFRPTNKKTITQRLFDLQLWGMINIRKTHLRQNPLMKVTLVSNYWIFDKPI